MEALLVLLGLYLVAVLLIFPIWVLIRVGGLSDTERHLRRELGLLEDEVKSLRQTVRTLSTTRTEKAAPIEPAAPVPVPEPAKPVVVTPPVVIEPPTPPPAPEPIFVRPIAVTPPPAVSAPPPPAMPEIVPALAATDAPTPWAEKISEPPPLPPVLTPEPVRPAYVPPPREPSWMDNINWEQFMGAKLFAWLGGLALLLGVAFFVKYSFDHGWVPPELRVALGFVFGAGLIVGGVRLTSKGYTTPAQTLVGAGVVSLYIVTFACNSIYKFEFFGPMPTFLVMTLITAAAFILAVRLEAQVIAILGILGGFLTPILINTGHDNPAGLFGYLTLLDAGLIAVALHRRWFHLVPLGAAGTVILMIGWAGKFYVPEKTVTAMTVCLWFSVLFMAAQEAARWWKRESPLLQGCAIALPGIAFGFGWSFLEYPAVAERTGLFFGYVALVSLAYFILAWREQLSRLVGVAAGAGTVLLVRWAGVAFTGEQTGVTMALCLAFCAVYLGIYLFARRHERTSPTVLWSAIGLPVVALGFAWFFLDYPEAAGRTGLFFGFVFLASLALFVLAWTEEQGPLVVVAAGAAVLLMARWVGVTFTAAQAPVVVTVCLAACAVYLGVYLLARWKGRATAPVLWSAVGLPLVALGFALFLMNNDEVAARPGLLFGFILLADLVLLALAWLDDRLPQLHLVAGLTVFALLSLWTTQHLTDALLPWALALSLVFATLHTVYPLVLQRHRPAATPTWWSQLFPPLTLLLLLVPIFKLETVSLLIWPAILLVDLLAIALAVLSASLAAVAAVLILTLLATGACIFRVPAAVVFAPSLLLVIGFFAVFFFGASLWLVRKLGDRLPAMGTSRVFGDARAQLPAFAALLPFLLLIMVCARLTVPDPSAVFGLGLLLTLLTLGLARLLILEWLPACALAGLAALEYAWHARHFNPADAGVPVTWYVAFYVVFAAYPFLFRRNFARLTGPWAVAALSGVAHFWMVYSAIRAAWPNNFLGLVPALFAAAPLASVFAILRTVPADNPKRLNQLAWFGGVALLFITLIFPIQFDRQWLTVAWALEGAALLWLFHRVPHRGLPAVGAVLLVIAFVRLVNPAVFNVHVRGDTAIFNWYLFAYGLATAALFTAAWLAAPPRERILGVRVPPLFNTLGTILAFLLLNIEVADYFTTPGARSLVFQFSSSFGRDMTHTIAWALFALGLLGAGIWQKQKVARYAAITLLSVALLKLFFHDLARLEALYRIGALFGVAVIAMLASFAYQRFLPSNEKTPPPQP